MKPFDDKQKPYLDLLIDHKYVLIQGDHMEISKYKTTFSMGYKPN